MRNILLLFIKRIIISCALILIGQSAFAQATYTVKLKLIDEKTSEPVSYATASLTVKGETTAARYVLTDAEGAASLAKVDFLKPTYGTVSRYGVISCAASGEQIGIYAKMDFQ